MATYVAVINGGFISSLLPRPYNSKINSIPQLRQTDDWHRPWHPERSTAGAPTTPQRVCSESLGWIAPRRLKPQLNIAAVLLPLVLSLPALAFINEENGDSTSYNGTRIVHTKP